LERTASDHAPGAISFSRARKNKPSRVHVDLLYFAVLEFLGLSENICDSNVAAFEFGNNNILKHRFSIKNHFKFTHVRFTNKKKKRVGYKPRLYILLNAGFICNKKSLSVAVLLYVLDDFQCDFFGFDCVFRCHLGLLVVEHAVYEVFV